MQCALMRVLYIRENCFVQSFLYIDWNLKRIRKSISGSIILQSYSLITRCTFAWKAARKNVSLHGTLTVSHKTKYV